jgi:hypothetical protein
MGKGWLGEVSEIRTWGENMTASEEVAMQAQELATARKLAFEKLREAEQAWYAYFGLCEVGPDRERAADVYEKVRTATRLV